MICDMALILSSALKHLQLRTPDVKVRSFYEGVSISIAPRKQDILKRVYCLKGKLARQNLPMRRLENVNKEC
jgi:hypothetical protein